MKKTIFIKLLLLFIVLEKVTFVVAPTLTTQPIDWMTPTFGSVEYILIGIFIIIAWDSLTDYNIELFSLLLFVLFGTIFRIDVVPFANLKIIFNIATWVVAGLVLFNILRLRKTLPAPKMSTLLWTVIGILAGLLFALLSVYFGTKVFGLRDVSGIPPQYPPINFIIKLFEALASNSDVQNEFIFRGILLGYLTRLLKDEKETYLLQGLAFWAFHFDRAFSSPITFWLVIPFSTLLFSLLVWKSRSLAPSIMASTFFDTFYAVFLPIIGHG